jgi:hypothetical protein
MGEDAAAPSSHDGPSGDRPGRKELAMAGSEPGPTDEVEGHGFRYGQDTEGVDEDRGGRIPDDAEGHGLRLPPEAVDEGQAGDDTAGHASRYHGQDPEATDDTEGHAIRSGHQDVEAVDEDQGGDDTEGHIGIRGG